MQPAGFARYAELAQLGKKNNDGKAIASEEVVGAVRVAYFDNSKTGDTIDLTEADDKLANFLCGGSSLSMRTVRV